jgi:hypothetical protein
MEPWLWLVAGCTVVSLIALVWNIAWRDPVKGLVLGAAVVLGSASYSPSGCLAWDDACLMTFDGLVFGSVLGVGLATLAVAAASLARHRLRGPEDDHATRATPAIAMPTRIPRARRGT